MARFTVYTTPTCYPCRGTIRAITKALGEPPAVVDLTEDAEALAFVRSLGYEQTPVVVVEHADGTAEHWSGHRPDSIDRAAARS